MRPFSGNLLHHSLYRIVFKKKKGYEDGTIPTFVSSFPSAERDEFKKNQNDLKTQKNLNEKRCERGSLTSPGSLFQLPPSAPQSNRTSHS